MKKTDMQAPEKVGRITIRKTANEGGRISVQSLLFFTSALLLLFAMIASVSIVLLESPGNTPKPTVPTVGGDNTGDQLDNDTPVQLPTLPANVPAAESTVLYRPTDLTSVGAIGGITSSAALVASFDTGKVMLASNADKHVQMASMTKVMTLIVACDYITDGEMLGEKLHLVYSDRLNNYSKAFVSQSVTSEDVYVIDALYGLILRSGADAAYGLAEHFAGSEVAFVVAMNEKAAALGMSDTHFTNCVGKDDNGQNYSSMRDVATMFIYALKNPLCEAIITEDSWICVGSYRMAWELPSLVLNSLSSKGENGQPVFGKVTALGGKSGNETMAGYCLVSLCERDGARYVVVTAGHPNSSYTDSTYIYKNYIK